MGASSVSGASAVLELPGKRGDNPHCGGQSPPLFVFQTSPRGTVVVHGTVGAHVSLTSSSTSMSHVCDTLESRN